MATKNSSTINYDWEVHLVGSHPDWETVLKAKLNEYEEAGYEIFAVYGSVNQTVIVSRRAPKKDESNGK